MSAPDPTPAPAVTEVMSPLVPRIIARDRVLPILIGVSVFVHATVFLPTLLRGRQADVAPPKEIPVEVVQLPPPDAPKPPAPKAPAAKPAPPPPKQAEQKPPTEKQKVAEKPQPKVAEKPNPWQKPRKSVAERMKDLLGPMPAVALPGVSPEGTEAASYTQLVLSKVAKSKKEGSYKGIPGAASVSFTLGDSGEVTSVEIVHASGDPSLDAEAIAMIKRGAPYPAPPPSGRRDYTITLRFQALI